MVKIPDVSSTVTTGYIVPTSQSVHNLKTYSNYSWRMFFGFSPPPLVLHTVKFNDEKITVQKGLQSACQTFADYNASLSAWFGYLQAMPKPARELLLELDLKHLRNIEKQLSLASLSRFLALAPYAEIIWPKTVIIQRYYPIFTSLSRVQYWFENQNFSHMHLALTRLQKQLLNFSPLLVGKGKIIWQEVANLAHTFYVAQRFKESELLWDFLEKKKVYRFYAYYGQGLLQEQKGNFQEAWSFYSRCSAMSHKDANSTLTSLMDIDVQSRQRFAFNKMHTS